ncbi:MAG: accessory gene regulator B family protein [Ruminococcus sp.]|nr:accessory gene regulator B family protein [Ruminococcus sp.]
MIARLSKRIASFFVRNEVIKSEDEEVYEYGLQLLLSTVFNGVIALTLAIISGTVLQCVCYLAVFVLLRKSAGGYHAKTHFGCCCILAVVLSLFIMFIKFVPNEAYGIVATIAVAFSVVIILMFAPLEHENKPIIDRDKNRLRKISVIYAVLFTLLVFVLLIAKLKMIMICVALGMFTASGSVLVAVIEKKITSIHLGT